jgi:hypothetical protein
MASSAPGLKGTSKVGRMRCPGIELPDGEKPRHYVNGELFNGKGFYEYKLFSQKTKMAEKEAI